jgi:hypothetical protein
MSTTELKKLIDLEPFRPFAIRLVNGEVYAFLKPSAFGAPEDRSVIFHFGQTWTLIDPVKIAEIIDWPGNPGAKNDAQDSQ